MTWTQTYTGRAFTPLDPRPEDVCLDDLAHSLALQCRFNGHCAYHYSVAQHSLYVERVAAPHLSPYAIAHDLAEAYVGDMTRPLKQLFPDFKPMENRVMDSICQALGLPWPWSDAVIAAVKWADDTVLAAERDQIMAPPPHSWAPLPPAPSWLVIEEWMPRDAEAAFAGFLYSCFPRARRRHATPPCEGCDGLGTYDGHALYPADFAPGERGICECCGGAG